MFYLAGIKRELLAQYQLLALRNNLNLITVTSSTMALLKLYKHNQGSQFRHSQLGIDLATHNHRVEHILDELVLNRYVTADPSLSITMQDEAPFLLPMLGLFIMRNTNNEYD